MLVLGQVTRHSWYFYIGSSTLVVQPIMNDWKNRRPPGSLPIRVYDPDIDYVLLSITTLLSLLVIFPFNTFKCSLLVFPTPSSVSCSFAHFITTVVDISVCHCANTNDIVPRSNIIIICCTDARCLFSCVHVNYRRYVWHSLLVSLLVPNTFSGGCRRHFVNVMFMLIDNVDIQCALSVLPLFH